MPSTLASKAREMRGSFTPALTPAHISSKAGRTALMLSASIARARQ